MPAGGGWATMFGLIGDGESEVAWFETVDWANDNDIDLAFISITPYLMAKHEIDEIVTLKYHPLDGPVIRAVGLAEILDVVMP